MSLPPLTFNSWLRYDLIRRLLRDADGVKRVLEIGAGGGAMGARLARRFEYVGVEPDAGSFDTARARLAEVGKGTIVPGEVSALDPSATFDVVCAFEVLEHLVRPLEEFRGIAALGADWIITSTELHPGPKPAPDWHYLSVESGQHVAFYRWDTLERLGRETGYPHVIAGTFFQIFARKPFPAWKWRMAVRLGALAFPIVRKLRPSLTVSDCESIRSRLRGE